jgi:hypothetical protein
MSNNIYTRLEEAHRTYLNPNIDNLDDLSQCYYIIKKYPPHEHIIWTLLVQKDYNTIFDDAKATLKLDNTIKENIKLAIKKRANNEPDTNYLEYLLLHRPERKLTLTLKRKEALVKPDIAILLKITPEEAAKLSASQLKHVINTYICEEGLQSGYTIKLDNTLRTILKLDQTSSDMSSVTSSTMHFFELHRMFNKIYMSI